MFLRDTEVFMGIYNGSQVSFVAVPPRSTHLFYKEFGKGWGM